MIKRPYINLFLLFYLFIDPCIYLFLRSSVLARIFVIFPRGGGAPMAPPSLKKKHFYENGEDYPSLKSTCSHW